MKRHLAETMGIKKVFLLASLVFPGAWQLSAQVADSLPPATQPDTLAPLVQVTDTLARGKSRFFNFRKTPPNPKTALKLSLIFPGAGQLYNGKWWKAPLVYGALGGMIYTIDFNQSRYQRLQTALELQLENQPHEFSDRITSPDALRSLRDQYDKATQLSYIGTFAVYVVIGVEAFVDAHLQNFDVSEDLSLRVKPVLILPTPTQSPAAGIGLSLGFRR
ncbi:MAG: hypothetical protein IPN20_05995 [Haliscomenobacter sp.]|nr:hypothetical protein [Haliscomenobacter sp.]